MKKLYLVDVSSFFFRAYYAIRPLTSEKGVPTNAIYGFLSMIVKLLREIQPDYLALCLDSPGPSFRTEIDENYKAHRGETPEDLAIQIPYIYKLVEVLGIPQFKKEKYEADDIIGSLCRFGKENKMQVVIVSGDKDFCQLIDNNCIMFDSMKNRKFDVDGVLEKWGVHPEKFIDYLAITGDSSDNIPGVRGIGPKGASKLLAEFQDLDDIYAHVEDIKSKAIKSKLIENKDNAYLSKKLVTIVQDLDLGVSVEDLVPRQPKSQELTELLDELSFQSFKSKLLGGQDTSITGQFESRKQIGTQGEFRSVREDVASGASSLTEDLPIVEKIVSGKKLLNWIDPKELIWFWATERAHFFAQKHEVLEVETLGEEQKADLGEMNLKWCGFDLKESWKFLNLSVGTAHWDSKLAEYVLTSQPPKNFRDILQHYTGMNLPEFPRASHIYSGHLGLQKVLLSRLREFKLLEIYESIELPVLQVLYKMEKQGILLNKKVLQDFSVQLDEQIRNTESKIWQEVGEKFNIASPKQLQEVLFEKLKMPTGKKTKTGYSTDSDVLFKLSKEYPVVNDILQFREWSKLKNTYTDALIELVDPDTGRIHTRFNQMQTTTGRLSSQHPNLQNIPIRTEMGRRIRKAFVAQKGHTLVAADYSQIELRILAHITQDSALVEAFKRDQDIHRATASEIFSVPPEEVTSELRRKAKAVNFGIAYGQGVYGLAETLNISRAEAKEIIERYFTKFPGVQNYMNEVIEQARALGYVETLLGRRRYVPELNSQNGRVRAYGERAAINAPIQGTASDIVKLAMIEVDTFLDKALLLQVHDELVFEIPDSQVQELSLKIQKAMQECFSLNVPLKVNVAVGKDWEQAHA